MARSLSTARACATWLSVGAELVVIKDDMRPLLDTPQLLTAPSWLLLVALPVDWLCLAVARQSFSASCCCCCAECLCASRTSCSSCSICCTFCFSSRSSIPRCCSLRLRRCTSEANACWLASWGSELLLLLVAAQGPDSDYTGRTGHGGCTEQSV